MDEQTFHVRAFVWRGKGRYFSSLLSDYTGVICLTRINIIQPHLHTHICMLMKPSESCNLIHQWWWLSGLKITVCVQVSMFQVAYPLSTALISHFFIPLWEFCSSVAPNCLIHFFEGFTCERNKSNEHKEAVNAPFLTSYIPTYTWMAALHAHYQTLLWINYSYVFILFVYFVQRTFQR